MWIILSLAWLIVISYFLAVRAWYKIRQELLCPYIIFLTSLYFFTAGQCFLLAVGIFPTYKNLIVNYPLYYVVRAQWFTLLSLNAFSIGAIVSAKIYSKKNEKIALANDNVVAAIKKIGWFLFIISFPIFTVDTITMIRAVISSGYGAIYEIHRSSRIEVILFGLGDYYFLPSLMLLLIAYKNNKRNRKLILTIMVIKVLIDFYIGGRTPAIITLICIICVYHYIIKPITKKQAVIFIVVGYFLAATLTIVVQIRGIAGRSLFDFLSFSSNENPVITLISELGGSMIPLIEMIARAGVQFPFRCGSTYLYGLTTIIPNLGFWDVHPAEVNASLGDWLQSIMGINYGPGFSMIAEAYLNFKWAGILAVAIIGFILGRLFSLVHRQEAEGKIEVFCLVMLILNSTVKVLVRDSAMQVFRSAYYIIIPIYIAIRLLSNSYEKKAYVSPPGYN